jgi:hypothetical protein
MKAGWSLLAVVAWCAGLAAPAPARAEDGRFYGMLRERDLTPFGFLRLDMRPAHAMNIEPHTFAFEMSLGYQNTWALSRNAERYLVGRESLGRHELGPADVEALRNLPGENYLLDVESATLDIGVHYKLSSQWTLYGFATAVSYQGGFMDSAIEQFHDTFGFSTFGRPAAARNSFNVILDLKRAQMTLLDAPDKKGFTDPVFGLRYSGIALPGRWEMSMEAAAKVPLQGERFLLSTGRTDYGMQASFRHLGERNAFHVDLSGVYYAGEDLPAPHDAQVIPTVVLGWEYILTDKTNLNLQGYASTSVYDKDDTDLEELLSEKFQLSLGLRHRLECCLMTFAITENLQNLNNTPDIGFQLGFAWVPRIAPQN